MTKKDTILTVILCVLCNVVMVRAQDFEWAMGIGGRNASETNYGVSVDGNGNVYVTGSFMDTVDFDPGVDSAILVATGSSKDIFLAKYDSNGNYLWVKGVGGSGVDESLAVTVDESDHVYITGTFLGTVDFNQGGSGGTLSLPNGGSFIAKYDSNGSFLWAIAPRSRLSSNASRGIAVDGIGNVFVTGYFRDSIDMDPGPGSDTLIPAGESDVFLAKYGPNGDYLWAKGLGGNGSDEGYGVNVDGTGNVYVTGFFASATVDFNAGGSGGILTPTGGQDAFLAKYDSGGNYLWAINIGSSGADWGQAVAVDDSGNVYLTGRFSGPADFDPGSGGDTLTSAGGLDMFVAKYDSSGNYRWANSMGGSGTDVAQAIAVSRGNVYVTGVFNSATANFNPGGTLAAIGGLDVFLAKYDLNGNYLWANSIGGSSAEQGRGIGVDGSGNVYVTGTFAGTIDYFVESGTGITILNSKGFSDVFVVKLACNDTSSSYVTVTVCGDSYIFNGTVYTSGGIHTQHFPNVSGCDSTIILDLILTAPDTAVTLNGSTLTASASGASYQWIDCDNGNAAVSGATSQSYTPAEHGSYAVAVTVNGCSDTSACYHVAGTGVYEQERGNAVSVYPNPAYDRVHISSLVPVRVTISSMDGRVVLRHGDVADISLATLADGVYMILVTDMQGQFLQTGKLVKQSR